VDVAIVEVGIGGQTDCTNVIRLRLSHFDGNSFIYANYFAGVLGSLLSPR
jgi:hypothetical protein